MTTDENRPTDDLRDLRAPHETTADDTDENKHEENEEENEREKEKSKEKDVRGSEPEGTAPHRAAGRPAPGGPPGGRRSREDERRLLVSEDEPRSAQAERDRYEQDYEL